MRFAALNGIARYYALSISYVHSAQCTSCRPRPTKLAYHPLPPTALRLRDVVACLCVLILQHSLICVEMPTLAWPMFAQQQPQISCASHTRARSIALRFFSPLKPPHHSDHRQDLSPAIDKSAPHDLSCNSRHQRAMLWRSTYNVDKEALKNCSTLASPVSATVLSM